MDRLGTDRLARVEDLASRADVSVDTIRFYQKRRLLEPPAREGRVAWYGPEHMERLARIRELQAHGFTLALIERVVSGEIDATDVPLAAAVATADTEAPEEFLTLTELSERSGVPWPCSKRSYARACCFRACMTVSSVTRPPTSRSCSRVCRCSNVAFHFPSCWHWRASTRTRRETSRNVRLRCSTSTCGNRCGSRNVLKTRKPTNSSVRSALLLPTITTLVSHHFRRVLLAVAQEHLERVGDDTELAAVSLETSRRLEQEILS